MVGRNGTLVYFENTGTPSASVFERREAALNPFGMLGNFENAVATFGDLNGDGVYDVVIGTSDGSILQFINNGTATEPSFPLHTATSLSNPTHMLDYSNIPPSPAHVGADSAPSLVDLDGDGDLDLVSGAADGSVTYWSNVGGQLRKVHPSPFGNVSAAGGHSALSFADFDFDGDLDALMGTALGGVIELINVGTSTSPLFVPVQGSALTTAIDLVGGGFSQPALADLNNDGRLDVTVGTGDGGLLYFEQIPPFVANTTADGWRGVGQMPPSTPTWPPSPANVTGLNLGPSDSVTWVDLDDDGDMDAIVGTANGTVLYYENVGTAQVPIFDLQPDEDNPFAGIDVGTNAVPLAHDIDGDGDFDLLVGAADGQIHVFTNLGTQAAPFVPIAPAFGGHPIGGHLLTGLAGGVETPIDLGSNSTPAMVDLDGDGDEDLVVGSSDGSVTWFRNDASQSSGSSLDPFVDTSFSLGGPFVEQPSGPSSVFGAVNVNGGGVPVFADFDGDGDVDLLVASATGDVEEFENVGSPSEPMFGEWPADGEVGSVGEVISGGVWPPGPNVPTIVDFNGDGSPDIVIISDDGTVTPITNVGGTDGPYVPNPGDLPGAPGAGANGGSRGASAGSGGNGGGSGGNDGSGTSGGGSAGGTELGRRLQMVLDINPQPFVSSHGRGSMMSLLPLWMESELSVAASGLTANVVAMASVACTADDCGHLSAAERAAIAHALTEGFASLQAYCASSSGTGSSHCTVAAGGHRRLQQQATSAALQITFDLIVTNSSAESPFASVHPDANVGALDLAVLQLACMLKVAHAAGSRLGATTTSSLPDSAGIGISILPSAGLVRVLSATSSMREVCPDPPPSPPPPSPPPAPPAPPVQPPPPSPSTPPRPPQLPIVGFGDSLTSISEGQVDWWIILIVAIATTMCCCIVCMCFFCNREPSKYHTFMLVKPEDDSEVGARLSGNAGKPCVVEAVEPGSPADNCLLPGDQLVSVHGISTLEGAKHATITLGNLPAGTYPVVVRRGKQGTRVVANAKAKAKRMTMAAGRGSVVIVAQQRVLETDEIAVAAKDSESTASPQGVAASTHADQ